ncbi:MAG: ribose-5-phosphate isomerase [Saprospiraceae bacterium]|jgi:predicted GIY-YIG superfamily endonuclease|nr:ribose-5-phosphate isomerase [Saprospiraceae bacterium]
MYQLYVIELRKTVFSENKKFREANPQFNGVLECLYVGMSSKSPKERFDQHKNGVLSKKGVDISAAIVKKYGIFLRPSLYAHIQSFAVMEDALKAEKDLASKLKRQRYAVWVN